MSDRNMIKDLTNRVVFTVSFVLALIIRKPLIGVLFAGVIFLLSVFGHSFGGLFFMVTAILYFLKEIID